MTKRGVPPLHAFAGVLRRFDLEARREARASLDRGVSLVDGLITLKHRGASELELRAFADEYSKAALSTILDEGEPSDA